MKKRTLFKTAATACLCLFFWGNVGNLRCETAPDSFRNAKQQAKMTDRMQMNSSDQEAQNDKNEGFKIMEWVIRQNLLKQYEKLEINPDLDESLD